MEIARLLSRIIVTLAIPFIVGKIVRIADSLILKPERLRSKLRKQGIRGPAAAFLLGNVGEIRKAQTENKSKYKDTDPASQKGSQVINHNSSSSLFPFFHKWAKEFGSTFMFSLGNILILHSTHPDMVKEISTCTSLDWGKPSYQLKEHGPLVGQGILTSNGKRWTHQRKVLAPEFYMEKVKGMMSLMVESSVNLLNSWNEQVRNEGGVTEIKIDDYMRSFSGDVISKACFGSNYSKGEDIFVKLRYLQEFMSKRALSLGIPILRFLPTKSNREIRRLEKDVRRLILTIVNERKEKASEDDLLQMILQGAATSELSQDVDRFIVDNCKNIYLAGYETTAVSATWTLMLLASNPEWQDHIRREVLEVCQGQFPDADMIRRMKTLTMVINESLRLYPPVSVISREALQDMKLGDIHVPKGVNVWTLTATLHQDPEIWGPDAHKFNPDRFVNGVSGACKRPHVYMPFGAGPRVCLGQNFALAELKILIAMIVSNFSFSLSPAYIHSPVLRLVTEPEHGVNLLIKKHSDTHSPN